MIEPTYDKETQKWVVRDGGASYSFRSFVAAWEFYQAKKGK